jgi:hypothetical protein
MIALPAGNSSPGGACLDDPIPVAPSDPASHSSPDSLPVDAVSCCPPGDVRRIEDWLRSFFFGPGEVCELRVIRKDRIITAGFYE